MAVLIDGKAISSEIKEELKQEVAELKAQGLTPCLAVILVGDDSASAIYVRNKKRACEYIGIESRSYELPKETTEQELENNVFQAQSIAQKHNCNLRRLDYQQEQKKLPE